VQVVELAVGQAVEERVPLPGGEPVHRSGALVLGVADGDAAAVDLRQLDAAALTAAAVARGRLPPRAKPLLLLVHVNFSFF
jgi:hypothetical protein